MVFFYAKDVYLKDGFFEPQRMIDLLIKEYEKSLSENYKSLYITGEMT